MSAEQAAAPHLCRDDFPLFRHQVAGHFPLLWREQTIYKPCKSIEVGFYQQMRDSFPALVPFTPKFYGVVSIDDPADVLARKRHEAESADSAVDSNSQSHSPRLSESSSVHASTDDEPISSESASESRSVSSPITIPGNSPPASSEHELSSSMHSDASTLPESPFCSPVDPVSAPKLVTTSPPTQRAQDKAPRDQLQHVHFEQVDASNPPAPQNKDVTRHSRSGSDWSEVLAVTREPQTNEYIVLEDLTSQYKHPCILDLKLGTRQHGLHESAEKIKSKTAKVRNSTSSSLGLRVCGMQVYHPGDSDFIFRDKYFGRSLDAASFEQNLFEFLHSGGSEHANDSDPQRRGHFREDLVPLLVERLEAFKRVVGLQPDYRFYSSSLLLLYEGAVPVDYDPASSLQSIHSRADVRFIDFAHAARTPPEEHGLLDCGLLMGLQNLIHLLLKIYHRHARNHSRAFPVVSSVRLAAVEQVDDAMFVMDPPPPLNDSTPLDALHAGDGMLSAADVVTPRHRVLLPSILIGSQRCYRLNDTSASVRTQTAEVAPQQLCALERDCEANTCDDGVESHRKLTEREPVLPVWGDEPVDVLEMTVTPHGHITAQRLKRAADFLRPRAGSCD